MAMDSYREAEDFIRLAWSIRADLDVARTVNVLIGDGVISANEIILLVQTALSREVEG